MEGTIPQDTHEDVEAMLTMLINELDGDGHAWVDADGDAIHIDIDGLDLDRFPVKQSDQARAEAAYFLGKAISSLQLAGEDEQVEALEQIDIR